MIVLRRDYTSRLTLHASLGQRPTQTVCPKQVNYVADGECGVSDFWSKVAVGGDGWFIAGVRTKAKGKRP